MTTAPSMTKKQKRLDTSIRKALDLPVCMCGEFPCPELGANLALRGVPDERIEKVLTGKSPVPRSARRTVRQKKEMGRSYLLWSLLSAEQREAYKSKRAKTLAGLEAFVRKQGIDISRRRMAPLEAQQAEIRKATSPK